MTNRDDAAHPGSPASIENGKRRRRMEPFSNAMLLRFFHTRFGMVPDYERVLELVYRQLIAAGDTVIDVGAHLGRHTQCFADLVGPEGLVLAFEPLQEQYECLLDKFKDLSSVKVEKLALTDMSGQSSFVHARGTPQESGLRPRVFNFPDLADPQTISVQVATLDSFLHCLPKPLKFIKIDTEGAEISILRGGAQLLRESRPFVSVEYGRPGYSVWGHDAGTLFEVAQAFGYQISDLFGAVFADLDTWLATVDQSYWDWMLVPAERVEDWQDLINGD
jgi:FkbM family methyltransferase